jgi:hypothetical protein
VVLADGEHQHAWFLAVWDGVALIYIAIGMGAVRRRRHVKVAPLGGDDVGAWLRPFTGPRFEFGTILAASLAGLTSAFAVLYYANGKLDALQAIGALGIVLAWMLLHAGYGRFYAALYYEDLADGGGASLLFPRDSHPTVVDFFYFSFTMGTSFAVSDVTVATPGMRWHVLVHSVLSFFYNAAVLALAVGILTTR